MIILANCNPTHDQWVAVLAEELDATVVNDKSSLASASQEADSGTIIFFYHWSFLIPPSVYDHHECVLFHMTDLPYGRGGSPLQNLIVRGLTETKMSALRVAEGLDTGDIYLKRSLSLHGTAREIFLRAGALMTEMTHAILQQRPVPTPQTGETTVFKRRKPADGDLNPLSKLTKAYDFIRMLDADGYPPAFVETEHFRFEFSRASLHPDQIIADVRITKK